MFISREEAMRRLTSSNNLASAEFNVPRAAPAPLLPEESEDDFENEAPSRVSLSVEYKPAPQGRGPNLGEAKQTQIAKDSIENPRMKQSDLALIHGTTQRNVSRAVSGKIGGLPANAERKAVRVDILNNAKDAALEKLMAALGLIDEEKLSALESAKDIGRFSKDMASVYNSLTAQTAHAGNQVNLIVYAPKSREESSFKVVDV